MSRRSTILSPSSHDGTSQRDRSLPALDPGYVAIDERSTADLLAYVQKFAETIRYFRVDEQTGELGEAGTWQAFAWHEDITIADMLAYIAEPERFAGDWRARWLGRPHFALLLAFVELLGHARAQLNELTRRHLDYFYRELLQMQPGPAEPDRAAVVFRLANRIAEMRLPAGTELKAGRDSSGVARIYRTENELLLNRAQVAALRSIFVNRRITGISDVRKNLNLTAREAFEGTLRIALGGALDKPPQPGEPVPAWHGAEIDLEFFTGLRQPLDFAREQLYLEHHELRELMRLVGRREAGYQWPIINELLGVENPTYPRDFVGNLESRVGELDFTNDGLPQVNDVDDLYEYRTNSDVRDYIETRLAAIGYDNFVKLMPLKLHIDAEWAAINRLLERAGRRKRGQELWMFPSESFDPTAFDANLTTALDGALPSSWPWDTESIYKYENRIRDLERHLSMPVERVARLVDFAEQLIQTSPAKRLNWSEIDRILAEAHRERVYETRRATLAEARGSDDTLGGFDAIVAFVLGKPGEQPEELILWENARPILAQYLDAGQLALLDAFRQQLEDPTAIRRFDWPDVYRVLELAQRYVEDMPEPVALEIQWRNLYAYEDARAQLDDAASSPRWKTFGRRPAADPQHPPALTLGWALRSPNLALGQGTRTLTLTLGFTDTSFDLSSFLGGLGLTPEELDQSNLCEALKRAWIVEASTAKGWSELEIAHANLAAGNPGDDYWSVRDVARELDENRPALQLVLVADVTHDAIAPLAGAEQPMLRLMLRQRWNESAKEWTTMLTPFEPLVLAAAHLRVDVEGLSELVLQHDERVLDWRKPFEPFGSRPAVGTRLYLGHPELVRKRLDMLRFDIEWMGLPASLASHYVNYPDIEGGRAFKIRMMLVDRSLEHELAANTPLFEIDDSNNTRPTHRLEVADVPVALGTSSPGFAYTRRLDIAASGDLRAADRYLLWELTPRDFGHAMYPSLAAEWAGKLAVEIANKTISTDNPVSKYQIKPPYTPTIKRLSVAYRTSIELDPRAPADPDCLLHIHPFGVARIDEREPSFLPRYDTAGELYIGLRDLDPPRHLSLLMQLAAGTSDPDLEPAPVSWSCLDGDHWQPVEVRHDSTRGLINTGIVELALPEVAPSTLLPGDLYWLRVAISGNTASVCDTVDIRAHAVMVRFDDRGNAADHYEQPLPAGSIHRLVETDARIAALEQPFTSFGGKPPERAELFYTRISERLRHKQRALSPWDYERLVLQRFGQIYKAKCLPASVTGEPGQVDVIVIPDIRHVLPSDAFAPKAPANLLSDIQTYVRERAPAAAEVRVRNAHYVPVSVRLGVRFMSGVDERFAKKQLVDELVRFLSPWAYDEGAELMIGEKIYASSILDFVDRRDYVNYVAELKLFRGREDGSFELIEPEHDNDYHVPTERPDQVLVAAREHHIDVISELGYQQASFTGINYMKLEFDFMVG